MHVGPFLLLVGGGYHPNFWCLWNARADRGGIMRSWVCVADGEILLPFLEPLFWILATADSSIYWRLNVSSMFKRIYVGSSELCLLLSLVLCTKFNVFFTLCLRFKVSWKILWSWGEFFLSRLFPFIPDKVTRPMRIGNRQSQDHLLHWSLSLSIIVYFIEVRILILAFPSPWACFLSQSLCACLIFYSI